jgi:putative acetyltransferase
MSAPSKPPALRPFLASDAPRLAEIFRASVEELTAEDYSEAQCAAWAAAADDEGVFAKRLAGQLTLIGTDAGRAVAFASLKGLDHIDMLYVDPAFARRKFGTALCDALEKLAGARGTETMNVDASDTALPFFQRRGYSAEHRISVERNGEYFGVTAMKKRLPASARERLQ